MLALLSIDEILPLLLNMESKFRIGTELERWYKSGLWFKLTNLKPKLFSVLFINSCGWSNLLLSLLVKSTLSKQRDE